MTADFNYIEIALRNWYDLPTTPDYYSNSEEEKVDNLKY